MNKLFLNFIDAVQYAKAMRESGYGAWITEENEIYRVITWR